MLIKIDCREKDLIACVRKRIENDKKKLFSKITVSSEQLSLGDIVICDDNDNIKVLFERKTLKDLAASISDGRYAEQGFRLTECELPNHNIIYLIEGSLHSYTPRPGGIPRTTLISSMVSMNQIKGFSLFKTNTILESCELLLCFASKLQKHEKENSENKQNKELQQNYVVVAKKAKKNSITKENINQIMLAQVPGVSSSIAETLIKKYNSLYDLLKEVEKDPNVLDNITMQTSTQKTRKISKTAIKNIKNFLLELETKS